jgi:phytoene dehydrogenase-like protein
MTEQFDAIVIGSGLGGLTAGALFSHAGYRVLLLERNDHFGGAATTYHRGRMTIEASLHETTDPRRGPDLKGEVFDALGLYDDLEFVPVDDFYEVRSPLIGDPLVLPYGFQAAAATLSERFPDDAAAIEHFYTRIERVGAGLNALGGTHSGRWWLTHGAELPLSLWPILRDLRSSVSSVLERSFGRNEALKLAVAANLGYYGDDPDTMWWLAFAAAQAGYLTGGGHYIKGGSQALSDLLVERIEAGDGEVRSGCDVTEIVLDDSGHAAGVRYRPTKAGESVEERAPVVFANAAPHVVADMLPEEARRPFMAPYVDKPLSISLFSIALGLERPPAEFGVSSYSTVLVPEWMTELRGVKRCADLLSTDPGERLPAMIVCDHNHIDSGIHTDGELYTLDVAGVDRLANWEHLDETAYRRRSHAWLEAIVAGLDAEWPGLAGAVVEQHIATARTMHEYLNTPEGAVYGWDYRVPEGIPRGKPLGSPETTVDGLWLASSYSGMGGFTGAIGGGTAAARAAMAALHP